MQRVTVYVDGFNLYVGRNSKGWRRYYWLDLRRLPEDLLRHDQRLVAVSGARSSKTASFRIA